MLHIIIIIMQCEFANKQIVWAKVKGYPWWPAEIAKLPTPEANVFKVIFVAEDTHAFLNPKEVRKYTQYYDECSKKKMRGLAPAIQAADELYKKRVDCVTKNSRSPVKSKARQTKTKFIRKQNRNNRYNNHQSSQVEEDVQSQESQVVSKGQEKDKYALVVSKSAEREEQEQQDEMISVGEESVQDDKFVMENEQRVDRTKIDSIEQNLLGIIEQIKQNTYKFNVEYFKQVNAQNLTGEELLQSKITNMLSFIIQHLKKEYSYREVRESKEHRQQHYKEHPHKEHPHKDHKQSKESHHRQKQDLKWLINIQKQFKQRILEYLNDTSYYDQYIKLIQRNKKNRNQYENKIIGYLKTNYKIKKELAIIFGGRLVGQINNGTLVKQKELLEDIKEKRADISNIINKAAIERSIENMIPKYM